MTDKISVLDPTVHDAFIAMKSTANGIIKTIDDAKDYTYLDSIDLRELLDAADCISGWVTELTKMFITSEKEKK